eukprot:8080521-Ditylum_brightwellii.AAC.1
MLTRTPKHAIQQARKGGLTNVLYRSTVSILPKHNIVTNRLPRKHMETAGPLSVHSAPSLKGAQSLSFLVPLGKPTRLSSHT